MRIALLQPTYWPEIRRGSERLAHDLGAALAARGHHVTLITSHDGPTTRGREDGIEVLRSRRPPQLARLRHYEYHLSNMPNVALRLLREDFDLAHAFFPVDAWAAAKARRWGGPPVVFSYHGVPVREHLVQRRLRLEALRGAIAGSAATTVLSEAAARAFRRYLMTEPIVLPGGVICSDFAVPVPRDERPTIVCAASLGDPRKRPELLFAAFQRLRRSRPEARLLLVRTRDPVLSTRPLDLPEGAEWVDGDEREALASAYASAWTSVLPAVHEAFGLVIVESLAAGTPVVAARSGACPEILTGPRLGELFEPDDESQLAAALDRALAEPPSAAVSEACRERAGDYDWSRVVIAHERLYAAVLEGSRAASAGS